VEQPVGGVLAPPDVSALEVRGGHAADDRVADALPAVVAVEDGQRGAPGDRVGAGARGAPAEVVFPVGEGDAVDVGARRLGCLTPAGAAIVALPSVSALASASVIRGAEGCPPPPEPARRIATSATAAAARPPASARRIPGHRTPRARAEERSATSAL